jgi:hypothetical protein
MCGKCWHQNLEGLEKADNRVPWLELVRGRGLANSSLQLSPARLSRGSADRVVSVGFVTEGGA